MSRPYARYWALGACAATLVGGCNQMLGIDDANLDARLAASAHASASGAGAAATAGMTTSAGTAGTPQGGGGSGAAAGGHNHISESGTGGNEGGNAGSDDAPSTGGTSTNTTGGTHSGSGSAGKMSGGAGGTSGTGGTSGATGGPSADPCDDYCDAIQTECAGEAEQYRDRTQCIKICHFLPSGDDDADDDNSVACRSTYVKKAHYGLGAEVTAYCRQAGPSGDGKCGTDCEAFCSVMMQVCTEDTAGPNHFASEAACLTACDALPPPTVHYSSTDPAVSDGNHALCRIFHVNSAAMADAEEHCEHAMGITLCQATP